MSAPTSPRWGTTLLSESQDVDVNYYVLVPFTTFAAAHWATGHIGTSFDCHIVSRAAVDQDAPVLAEVVGDE